MSACVWGRKGGREEGREGGREGGRENREPSRRWRAAQSPFADLPPALETALQDASGGVLGERKEGRREGGRREEGWDSNLQWRNCKSNHFNWITADFQRFLGSLFLSFMVVFFSLSLSLSLFLSVLGLV